MVTRVGEASRMAGALEPAGAATGGGCGGVWECATPAHRKPLDRRHRSWPRRPPQHRDEAGGGGVHTGVVAGGDEIEEKAADDGEGQAGEGGIGAAATASVDLRQPSVDGTRDETGEGGFALRPSR